MSKVGLIWVFFGMACVAFTFVHLILRHFSYSDQFMRILNNCKMDQQENLVALHSFKQNYLNPSKEQLINFNSVCCNFYNDVRIIPKKKTCMKVKAALDFLLTIFWRENNVIGMRRGERISRGFWLPSDNCSLFSWLEAILQ